MVDSLIKKSGALEQIRLQRSGGFIFYACLLLFFLALAAYGGLVFVNKAQTQARDEIMVQVKAKEEELRPELVNQIFLLESRLKNIQIILSNHTFPSNVLKFLEVNTIQRARFLNFSLDVDARKLEMTGETASYTALTEQMLQFEQNPQVEKVEFGGLTLSSNNLVNFRVSLTFKPSLLKTLVQP